MTPLRVSILLLVFAAGPGSDVLLADTAPVFQEPELPDLFKKGEPIEHHLVDLESLNAGFKFDIPYAGTRNFTKRQLYPVPKAFLHRDAAAALVRAQEILEAEGLGLLIFDGYRPLSVQWLMFELIGDERYVSNPSKNRGRHTRGTAIDVTLVDAQGKVLEMPTAYDDFTEKAHQEADDVTPEQRKNRAILRQAMLKAGFKLYPYEWWHFDFGGWEKYPVLDIRFGELTQGQTKAAPIE